MLAVCAILTVMPALTGWAAPPGQSGIADLQAQAEKGGYRLIDINTLWDRYQDNQGDLLLVDTRQDWEYHSGHIKGARLFSMEPTWLARLTQKGALEQFLGPDKTKTIVFY